jgi:hypothetical protein
VECQVYRRFGHFQTLSANGMACVTDLKPSVTHSEAFKLLNTLRFLLKMRE